jgi:hypothetical protein
LVGSARSNNGHDTLPFLSQPWYMPPKLEKVRQNGEISEQSTELNQLNYDLNRRFELGTVFTLIAGLLNVLVIYDAWSGPAYGATRKKEEEKDEGPKAPDDKKPGADGSS